VILDGKIFASDRCSAPMAGVKGQQIDADSGYEGAGMGILTPVENPAEPPGRPGPPSS
jgi:hypothetical protein